MVVEVSKVLSTGVVTYHVEYQFLMSTKIVSKLYTNISSIHCLIHTGRGLEEEHSTAVL